MYEYIYKRHNIIIYLSNDTEILCLNKADDNPVIDWDFSKDRHTRIFFEIGPP